MLLTKKVSTNGKIYVLVDKAAEKKVRESLQKRFDGWYREVVPEDAKPKEGQFDGPGRNEQGLDKLGTKSTCTF